MSAHELIQYTSWIIYLTIFVVVLVKTIRQPTRANMDMTLLFGLSTAVIVLSITSSLGLTPGGAIESAISGALLLSTAYALVRLVDDFSTVPYWLEVVSGAALGLVITGHFAFLLSTGARPGWFVLLELLYLVTLIPYSVVAFYRQSRLANGVTRRRMRAVAGGSLALCLVFVISGLTLGVPQWRGLWGPLSDAMGLVSGVCFYLGFAPPSILRRAWQEPELRAFLGRAAVLPRLPDTEAIVREMEKGAANSVGAPEASIGLWDESEQKLLFDQPGGTIKIGLDPTLVTARAFIEQKPAFTANLQPDHPLLEQLPERPLVRSLMAAPISAGDRRLGVLAVYAPRTPIFAEEDVGLVKLLADQAAVVLESRALIDEAARVRAREEVARLKEDFLSAAAHDLKTPLTTLVGQAQLLERRALRNPDAPLDVRGVQKLVREAERLKNLVLELLDAARAEQGRLVGEREPVDVVSLAEGVCTQHNSSRHPCVVIADAPVVGIYDGARIMQLLENLIENAVKYSPEGGTVTVRLWSSGLDNYITVSDAGIGIPTHDLPHIFDRFHRAGNVDDRRFAGMGLGLYICRGIVEQHEGRIWATSKPGRGSTFHIVLPAPNAAVSPAPEEVSA